MVPTLSNEGIEKVGLIDAGLVRHATHACCKNIMDMIPVQLVVFVMKKKKMAEALGLDKDRYIASINRFNW